MGICMGVGKHQFVIITSFGGRPKAGINTNRKMVTMGKTISGNSYYLPPIIIPKGKIIQRRWVVIKIKGININPALPQAYVRPPD